MNQQKLQNLCVKCIACNFDRFHCAMYSPAYDHFFKHFHMLQKLYGGYLLKLLSETDELRNEHLAFILNKYTKELNMMYLANCDFHVIEERLQEIGSGLTSFTMCGVRKLYNTDNFLKCLTRIQVLDVAHSKCSNRSLVIIAENCQDLKNLNLQGTPVTDKGLAILCQKKPPLERLNVERTSVTYKGVALVLKQITSLTHLHYENVPCAVSEAAESSEKVPAVFNLNNLVIFNNPLRPGNYLNSVLETCIRHCPHIKELFVTEILTEDQLDLIADFQNLQQVSLQGSLTLLDFLSIDNFLEVRGEPLTVLSLTTFCISTEVLASCCPNLVYFNLGQPIFEAIEDSSKINFPNLKMFSLQNSEEEFTENAFAVSCIISNSPNLEDLHVINSHFTTEIQDAILNCPKKLRVLNFNHTRVKVEFVEEVLRTHNTLHSLMLNNSGISMGAYDDLMDLVDEMENKVHISCADYTDAIRELFTAEDMSYPPNRRPCVLKL